MKFEAITIKDIATKLGISTSTVSRALRDSYEISAETKKLVLDCAERLNYRPNPIALSLKEKRSGSIGVIVCEIANSFFSQAINGIESIAGGKGYNVIISQSRESFENELSALNFLASRSIDGLLISISSKTQDMEPLKKLHARGLPIVFFDRITEQLETHKVIIDNHKASYEATDHLLKQGFRKIACVANAAHLSIAKERIAGYKDALADHNIEHGRGYIKECEQGGALQEEVEKAVSEILEIKPRPDAIIALSDKITTGCLRVLQAKKIKVPGEMGLIGFSNSDLTDMLNPSLSIIQQPAFEMGQIATSLLLQLVESKRPVDAFTRKILETNLIIRNSTSKGH